MKKSRDEVIQSILSRFENQTELVNAEPGSIVRTFSEVLAEEFYEFYNELELVSMMSFVSTAKGQFLDLIGAIVNCARLEEETDDNYRVRITQQVYVVAGANETAIRLRLLNIDGVRDVILEPYVRGTGSFAAYIITDEANTPEHILQTAQTILDEAKAYGIRAEARKPLLISMKLKVRLVFEEGTPQAEITNIKYLTERTLKSYIDNLPLGGLFVVNEAIRRVKNLSSSIVDLSIYEMHIGGVQRFVRNISASKGERFLLEQIEVI